MRYKALLKLSCGHLRLLREIAQTPEVAWCNACEDAYAVVDAVTTVPETRDDNGHIF